MKTFLFGSFSFRGLLKLPPLRKRSVIPGFHLSLGFTLLYTAFIVIIPLSMLLLRASGMGWERFYETLSSPRVLSSFTLSFTTSFIAALISLFCGTILTWVLVRYPFPMKSLIDGMIDLPFAMPTAVAGITFTSLYATDGAIGSFLASFGISADYTPAGIIIVLVFISFPFVVRTLEPVLEDLSTEYEEAAASLGASRFQTIRYIIFPALFPALLSGFTISFARTLGEYGSVVFISGNIPFETEIVPLMIVTRLESFDIEGACAIALVSLIIAFFLLFLMNMIKWWSITCYNRYLQK